MANLPIPIRKTHGMLDAGYVAPVRMLDFVIDLTKDVTMTTATDVIQMATLQAGTMIVGGTVEQVIVGTGTGTLQLRVGATAVNAPLTSTDPVGTRAATIPAAIHLVVPLAGAELELVGTLAARTTGVIRVVVAVVEGYRHPNTSRSVGRDASTGLS